MKFSDYRKNRGMTQEEVANRMGVTQVMVSKIERSGNVTVKTLRQYFNAMGYKLDIEPKFVGYNSFKNK